MCGIFGLLTTDGSHISDGHLHATRRAAKLMERRGPDDEGFWNSRVCAFSFRRLSILDLTQAGHQPMQSTCGQYTIVFNGEIYNFRELRKELETRGHRFRSHADTEVVLNSLIEWGSEALTRFNGMFAIAFWDAREQSVLISRDHVGMKPLYYAIANGLFVFGSQLNQIMLCFHKEDLTLDRMGLGLFLSIGYYPSPRTVFEEIHHLDPGAWLKVDAAGDKKEGHHFTLLDFYQQHRGNIPDSAALEDGLLRAVERHLVSDVPVATFLSGGLDSGIITALATRFLGTSFTAYTLSNPGTRYDETERAGQVADFLGIKHEIVPPTNILEAVLAFQDAYQEPFGDYSALPSILVTAEASKNYKVMLSGDGSDEFFFGYNRMTSMLQGSRYYWLPFLVRRIYKRLGSSARAIRFPNTQVMILRKQSVVDETLLVKMGFSVEELAAEFLQPHGGAGLEPDMLIKLNTIHRYFQLQLLKLDRATMYNSVEARIPFADRDFLKLTIAYTAADATQDHFTVRKVPLQRIYDQLYPNMPRQEGPKKGFTIDMATMLRGVLRDYYFEMLGSDSVFSDLIDFKPLRDAFLKGQHTSASFNFGLLSLQSWSGRYWGWNHEHSRPRLTNGSR